MSQNVWVCPEKKESLSKAGEKKSRELRFPHDVSNWYDQFSLRESQRHHGNTFTHTFIIFQKQNQSNCQEVAGSIHCRCSCAGRRIPNCSRDAVARAAHRTRHVCVVCSLLPPSMFIVTHIHYLGQFCVSN